MVTVVGLLVLRRSTLLGALVLRLLVLPVVRVTCGVVSLRRLVVGLLPRFTCEVDSLRLFTCGVAWLLRLLVVLLLELRLTCGVAWLLRLVV